MYLQYRLNSAISAYDDRTSLTNTQAFDDTQLALNELIETGLFVIRWSGFQSLTLKAYREISDRIVDFQNTLRSRTSKDGMIFGHSSADIIHDMTIHRCTLYAAAAQKIEDIKLGAMIEGLTRTCHSALTKEQSGRQVEKREKAARSANQSASSYFAARCARGDRDACDAVREIDRPRTRPGVREQMERNCKAGDTSACAYLNRQ